MITFAKRGIHNGVVICDFALILMHEVRLRNHYALQQARSCLVAINANIIIHMNMLVA